jgi:hypothetical protein
LFHTINQRLPDTTYMPTRLNSYDVYLTGNTVMVLDRDEADNATIFYRYIAWQD